MQGEMIMPTKRRALPPSMPSPETGEPMTRGVRPFTFSYKGHSATVDLPGYYPAGEGEGVHVGDDMKPVDDALDALKEKVDGLPAPATIQRLRQKLSLSQSEAGALFKVGETAFDEYERGIVTPSGPALQLLKLLDLHPELIHDLR